TRRTVALQPRATRLRPPSLQNRPERGRRGRLTRPGLARRGSDTEPRPARSTWVVATAWEASPVQPGLHSLRHPGRDKSKPEPENLRALSRAGPIVISHPDSAGGGEEPPLPRHAQ